MLLLRTDWGRLWWDKIKLTVPLFKKLFRALYISRSLHTMGQLINAGVPMLDTIAITAEISGNTLYRRMWRAVYGAVKQGKKISAAAATEPAAAACGRADDRRRRRIRQARRSARRGLASTTASELKAVIKGVTAMIEPLMIVMMGCDRRLHRHEHHPADLQAVAVGEVIPHQRPRNRKRLSRSLAISRFMGLLM